jgi:5-methylcytosine-specific restriction protein A
MTRKHPDAVPPFKQPPIEKLGGRARCRWCWNEVGKGRQSWCSDECVEEYMQLHDWATARGNVRKRDHEVCAFCGVDTGWLKLVWNKLRGPMRDDQVRGHHDWLTLGQLLCGNRDTCREWWEADHIKPRADGGDNALANLRTLCLPCHRGVTAAFARERARRRREARAALFTGGAT